MLLTLCNPALGDHVQFLGPLVDGVLGGVVDLGIGPNLLDVLDAEVELAVVVVVESALHRGQVHGLGHNLEIVRVYALSLGINRVSKGSTVRMVQ